jgi:signal transduction histidine kinase
MDFQLPTAILDSMTSGVLAVDLESRILFLNTSLCRRLSVDRDSWVGKPAAELFAPVTSRVPPKRSPLYRLAPGGDNSRTLLREVEWREDNKTSHLREDSSPLYNQRGRVIGRLLAYHDLSMEKAIDQMKSEFISIASHELRTPMTSIKGSVDLILGGYGGELSPEARDLLEIAHSGCDRMIRLINNILDLSKIEAGQTQLQLALVDLREIAERSLRPLWTLAAPANVTLRIDSPPTLPPVEADRDRMEQVITNLVSNAIKFSPRGEEVVIRFEVKDGWVQCSVSDRGCGIEEKDLERIFGKFQQVNSHSAAGGTGLGLAITHALVTEHRGKIWVESRVGQGSRFVFCLPRVPD